MSWQPYRPPWYDGDQRPQHNPFAMNGQEGMASGTKYGDWCDALPAGELVRRIEAHQKRQREATEART